MYCILFHRHIEPQVLQNFTVQCKQQVQVRSIVRVSFKKLDMKYSAHAHKTENSHFHSSQ